MIKILKENSYNIIRFFIFQVGITIFSLMLYFSVSVVDDNMKPKIQLAISIFSIFFYLFLIYTASWEYGAKDKIRIDGGRMTRTPMKGAIMLIAANLLNFVLAFLCTLFMGIYLSGGPESLYTAFSIINMILRLVASMYVGVINTIFQNIEGGNLQFFFESIGYLVIPLLSVLTAHVAYTLGLHDRKIFSKNNPGKQ